MEILKIRTLWTEWKNFRLERKDTGDEYIFLYYHTPVSIWIDGVQTITRPGAWIIYDKHSYQLFQCTGEVLHDWFHLSGDMDPIMEKCGLEYNKIYYAGNSSMITGLMQQLEFEWLMRNAFWREICDSLLETLFMRLARQHMSDSTAIEEDKISLLMKARAQIHSQYQRNWQVKDMAELISVSQPQFYKLYKSVFGTSPKSDLLAVRIEHAKQLLLYRRSPVPEIAEATGFTNEYHFIRLFKAHTGTTPAKYRADWMANNK